MHSFKIVSQTFPEPHPETGEPWDAPWYTFLVSDDDGKTWLPSMKWYRECNVPGLPKTYYVERCINRLKAGRSSEAFGGHQVVTEGGHVVGISKAAKQGRATVKAASGPTEVKIVGGKPREARRGFVGVVDGTSLGEFPTEAAAKSACAIHAFMTRNKLGRIHHAMERLQAEFHGKECKVFACCERHEIVATVDGAEYSIGWLPPDQTESREWEVERFKKK